MSNENTHGLSDPPYTGIDEWVEEKKVKAHHIPYTGPHTDQILRAEKYLAKIDPAIEGQGGNCQTFRAACVLVQGFALNTEAAYSILSGQWNNACQPPWPEADLREKILKADAQPGLLSGGTIKPRGCMLSEPFKGGSLAAAQTVIPPTAQKKDTSTMDTVPQSSASTPPNPKRRTSYSAGDLMKLYPKRRPYVIEGLLRRGELLNIISASKSGKSWTRDALALAIETGEKWFDFRCIKGRTLILDNELHREELSHRLRTVATALHMEGAGSSIVYEALRGELLDINGIAKLLINEYHDGDFDMIFIDSLYKAIPKGISENDNAGMGAVFNEIERIATYLNCCIGVIHHSTKGNQAGKNVLDVGSGAGAMARACDAHLVLREHEKPDIAVVDGKPRSSPPLQAKCFRWEHPLWIPAFDEDATRLKGPRSGMKKDVKPELVKIVWTMPGFVDAFITNSPRLKASIMADANERKMKDNMVENFLKKALAKGKIFRWVNGPHDAPTFATIKQPSLSLN